MGLPPISILISPKCVRQVSVAIKSTWTVIRMQTPKNVGIFSHDKTEEETELGIKKQQNSREKFGPKPE